MAAKNIDNEEKMSNTNVAIPLNFNNINEKAKLRLKTNADYPLMSANHEYLLYCPEGYLRLLNDQGHTLAKAKRNFSVSDICWSSYLNQFLVLDNNGKLYSMDVNDNATKHLKQVQTFSSRMKSITCYENTFVVSNAHDVSFIEEYNLSNWKLVRKHEPPFSCQVNQQIWQIRLNSNGTHLGVILRNKDNSSHTFELRHLNDMKVIQLTKISDHLCNDLLSLSNQRFLINTWTYQRKIYI
jgi:hypothetical protein